MDVVLAGFNVDHETLKTLGGSSDALTPETISAAYARISRNPLPVTELRAVARKEVASARRSNERIIFDMGHNSVAEHAVFNFDVLGVSRFAVEEVEKFRLCSYTEKSQRYIRLEDDCVIPAEVEKAGLGGLFRETLASQIRCYHDLYGFLRTYQFETNRDLAADRKNLSLLEGWAKEDARYILSLAMESQLGMTVNARNLELMIRRSAAHPLEEVQTLGRKLFERARPIAPSLIRYTAPTDYDSHTRETLRRVAEGLAKNSTENWPKKTTSVRLLFSTPDADTLLAATLLHGVSSMSMEACLRQARTLEAEDRRALVAETFRRMASYDAPLREFETIDFLFELTISASCFAQMKRHRMATILCQDYDPLLGTTLPPAVRAVGMESRFNEAIELTEKTYRTILPNAPRAAAYMLTNAHRKRIILKTNARELYHISRLREDSHAQWDIRETAALMISEARRAAPLTMMMAGGKDRFETLKETLFDGRPDGRVRS